MIVSDKGAIDELLVGASIVGPFICASSIIPLNPRIMLKFNERTWTKRGRSLRVMMRSAREMLIALSPRTRRLVRLGIYIRQSNSRRKGTNGAAAGWERGSPPLEVS